MAAYFMLSFLTLILVPLTYSLLPSRSKFPLNRFELGFFVEYLAERDETDGCPCSLCVEQRARLNKKEKRSVLKPKLGPL